MSPTAALGDRLLRRGSKGRDVVDLQICLAGFRGTLPDGQFGSGTELQVMQFQSDFLGLSDPSGEADAAVIDGILRLAAKYPLDFKALECPCGECGGFGQGRFLSRYRSKQPRIEAYHRYEYPGIHRMILWAVRGAFSYIPHFEFVITSGYRCGIQNERKNRTSTNHHGKAVDIDIVRSPGDDKRDDMIRCDKVRSYLVELASAQIGWGASNRKALEPSHIAPTWVHYDVRCYERKYLKDDFFCRNRKELDLAIAHL